MPQNSPFTPQAPPANVMKIIRGALTAGALLFGVVAYVQQRGRTVDPSQAIGAIRVVAYVFCLGALAAVMVIRGIRATKEPAVRATFSLIGWSVGEASALMGGIFMLLGGEPWPFCAGILVLLFAWMQLPADPDEA
jgi:hypothetical protein